MGDMRGGFAFSFTGRDALDGENFSSVGGARWGRRALRTGIGGLGDGSEREGAA